MINIIIDPSETDPIELPIAIKSRKTILTDAQIKSLSDGQITLVPPPGEGKILVFNGAIWNKKPFIAGYDGFLNMDAITIYYDTIENNLDEGLFTDDYYNISSLGELLGNPDPVIFYDKPYTKVLQEGYLQLIRMTGAENKALVTGSYNFGSAWTGGHSDNTIEVTVYYSVVSL